jgi:hypothetical protein
MARRPRTSELLGAPVVPPPPLTRVVLTTRRLLARLHRSTAPPSIRVLEALLGVFDNRTLGLLVELDVPDRLVRRRTAAELAGELGVDADGLERLLRYACARGFVGMDRRGRFFATPVTEVLRRTHRNSWRGWVEFAGSDWFWAALRHLDARVLEGRSGMEAAHGADFFTFVTERQPEAGTAFADAMAAGATVQALALERGLDWSGVRTVCDVGGGTGAALEYLLSGNDELTGILFDLPAVVAAARPGLTDGPLSGRCQFVGGSFFEEVPAGADRYLFLAIVHDWDDESACRLLATTAAALGERGRAVVVEQVLSAHPRDEFAQSSDLLMAALASGRERTQAQLEALFRRSGLRVTGRRVLATGFTAFELARNG